MAIIKEKKAKFITEKRLTSPFIFLNCIVEGNMEIQREIFLFMHKNRNLLPDLHDKPALY